MNMNKKIRFVFCALWAAVVAGCGHGAEDRLPLVHAHRGGAALYPENTIEAMVNAVRLGVPVLEMDLQVTRDSCVVVSHDAYLNAEKALTPAGKDIPEGKDKEEYRIYDMDYDSLRLYDVGSKPHPAYPGRVNLKCHVPLFSELVENVENAAWSLGDTVYYNVEIKSDPSKDGVYSPDYRTYADLCMRAMLARRLGSRLLVQCFDPRTLNYLHERYPSVRLSYLVEDSVASFEEMMARLDFTPQVFSPESRLLTEEMMEAARAKGMEVVPWTVDDREEVERLRKLGVDAIITNRPDRVMEWLGYPAPARSAR